jgi:hypothetical protein
MDLIAQAVAAVLSFFAAIVGNVFAHDICASADRVCAKIIKAAAARLAAFDQASTEQETPECSFIIDRFSPQAAVGRCLLSRRCQATSRHPANESRPPLLTLAV